MKYKFRILKNGIEAFSKDVETIAEGDAWVEETKHAFGKPDRQLTLQQLLNEGLTVEQAASVEEKILSDESVVTVYNFAKDWVVDYQDISKEVEHAQKKMTRKQVREKCMDLFDEIGIVNEGKEDAHMDAIFMNPSFMAIVGALVSGAPKTAKRYVQSLGPSLYSAEKVSDIVSKLDAIIASS